MSLSPQALLLDDEEEETEEEITAAYEALYGKAFSGLASSKSDSRGMDDGDKGRRDRGPKEFEERVVQIRRVTKVVKGGKQLSFRAVVVLGDKKGRVGVGVAKAKEVIIAVQKAGTDARRHIVTVPMTKYLTFPHRADGQYGAAKVMLRPAATGTGVIAGGSVRVVLELAGVENALGKEIGSKNPLNNARAVVEAVTQMKQFRDVAADRGIPMEELWK
jgi:small subunit ribosomal protein S5